MFLHQLTTIVLEDLISTWVTYTNSQAGSNVRVLYLTIWACTRDSDLLACVKTDLARVSVGVDVVIIGDVNRLRLTEVTSDSNCASLNQNVIPSQSQ